MLYHVYINLAAENKLSIYTMDPSSGALQLQEDVPLSGGPGPLAISPDQRFLYVGVRSGSPGISSFRIDQESGGLTPLSTICLDADPCYVKTDRKGRYLLASYYGAGRVTVHGIGGDGAVAAPPVEWVETASNAHSIQTDATNRFAFVPHIAGPNVIFQFEFDEETGQLTPNDVPKVIPEEGAGPRHFCFYPNLDTVYFVNEQGGSVTAYRMDTSAGTLAPFQTVSTLPEDFTGANTCAQIWMSPSGRFLYASNRGHDSIACFTIDSTTGEMTSIGQQPTEEMPRAFNLDPAGQFLLATGLVSGRLATYRIDQETGALSPLETYEVGERPMWVSVVDLDQ